MGHRVGSVQKYHYYYYFYLAEAKVNLVECIRNCHESVTDPEKAAGRVTKEEKV